MSATDTDSGTLSAACRPNGSRSGARARPRKTVAGAAGARRRHFRELSRARTRGPRTRSCSTRDPPTANGRPGNPPRARAHAEGRRSAATQFDVRRTFRRPQGRLGHARPAGRARKSRRPSASAASRRSRSYGVADFNAQAAASRSGSTSDDWERLSERIGYWLDYGAPVRDLRGAVRRLALVPARAVCTTEGLVYRGKRVLPYCGRCGTGLSSHELGQPGVYRDVLDPSVTIRFRLKSKRRARRARELAGVDHDALDAAVELRVGRASRARLPARARGFLPVAQGRTERGSAGLARSSGSCVERAEAVLGKGFEELERRPRQRALVGKALRSPCSRRCTDHRLAPVSGRALKTSSIREAMHAGRRRRRS